MHGVAAWDEACRAARGRSGGGGQGAPERRSQSKKDPAEPKGSSASAAAEQKRGKRQLSGEAKSSELTWLGVGVGVGSGLGPELGSGLGLGLGLGFGLGPGLGLGGAPSSRRDLGVARRRQRPGTPPAVNGWVCDDHVLTDGWECTYPCPCPCTPVFVMH